MATKYSKKYSLMFGDMDINYRMTKIALAKYFQETFARYCTTKNLAAFDIINENLIWVISDLKIEILGKMPFWSEDFEVELWVSEKTKLRTYVDFVILYKNEIIAKGDSCWFILNADTRRPIKTLELLNPFEVCNECVFKEHIKENYEQEGEKISEKIHTVTVRDLDFNFHVNNLSYLGFALETIPSEYFDKYDISSYSVKFLKEALMSDKLSCELFRKNNELKGRIYNAEDNSDVCVMKAELTDRVDFEKNPRSSGVVFC